MCFFFNQIIILATFNKSMPVTYLSEHQERKGQNKKRAF